MFKTTENEVKFFVLLVFWTHHVEEALILRCSTGIFLTSTFHFFNLTPWCTNLNVKKEKQQSNICTDAKTSVQCHLHLV